MGNVAIVGIGIHPFGRFSGVTGRQMGVHAVRLALQDAGIEWKNLQFAFGGSLAPMLPLPEGDEGSGLADTLVSELGLTGLPFVNVANGCAPARAGRALGGN